MNIFIFLLIIFIGVLIGERFIKEYGKKDWITCIGSLFEITCFIMLFHILFNDEISNKVLELCNIEHTILRILFFIGTISLFFLRDNKK